MPLADFLTAAHDHFYSILGTVNATLGDQPDSLDLGRQQARVAFHEKLHDIFSADYQPIVAGAGAVSDKLLQLMSALAKQKDVYSRVFAEQVDRDAASQESSGALKDSVKRVLA